jgi:3-hydroxyisobutyrate dehydrogenase-like beta-hydroxyacid dehydrogenase
MLPKGPHVKAVFTDPKTGLLSASPSHSILFMECSTIDTATSNEVNTLATSAGHRFVDAPVSGGPNGANAGTLTFMIGGSADLFAEVRPLAEAMGKKESIFHCGDAGAGLATKQINNYLSAVSMIGTSEAFNMGRLYGLDPKTLASVINVSTGRCYNSSEQNPVKGVTPTSAAARDFEGGFSMELCVGVLEQAMQLRHQVGAKSLLSEVVMDSFQEASQDERCKGKDYRSFYRWFADI